jgi:Icc-related predicted phosphoesterase
MVIFLIVGDLHGNKPEIYYKKFDAIIAPGDFCSDAPRKYMFQALKERIQTPKSKINWYDLVGKKEAKKLIEKSILDGRNILKHLDSFGVPVYIVPGNWDWTKNLYEDWSFVRKDNYKRLIKGLSNIVEVHNKILDIGDYNVIGNGISSGPEYPQHKEDLKKLSPKELTKKKREYVKDYKRVELLFKRALKPTIFLSHNVPFNTSLDMIIDKKSPRYGYHYGSLIAREIINKYQPLVFIGGHMHEHFKKCKIGKTIAINAGFGPKVNILLELEKNKIKKLEFHK